MKDLRSDRVVPTNAFRLQGQIALQVTTHLKWFSDKVDSPLVQLDNREARNQDAKSVHENDHDISFPCKEQSWLSCENSTVFSSHRSSQNCH